MSHECGKNMLNKAESICQTSWHVMKDKYDLISSGTCSLSFPSYRPEGGNEDISDTKTSRYQLRYFHFC